MILFRFYLLTTLICLAGNSLRAQEWTAYQSQQQVNDLVDTGDELLLATDAGLVVMNKTTLEKTVFNTSNSNLPTNDIKTITMGPDNSVWIGTYDVVVARFDGNDFGDFNTPDAEGISSFAEIYDLKVAPNGDFWVGTTDGVLHKEGEEWQLYDSEQLGPLMFEAWDIEINNAGDVFVASNALFKFSNGSWSNLTDSTSILAYLGADLFFGSEGDLYFVGDLNKIGRYDGEQWEELPFGDLNGSTVVRVVEDLDGSIYFNTLTEGLYKLVEDAWVQQADPQAQQFGNHTDFFHIDAQGRRWLNNGIDLSVAENGQLRTTLISENTLESNQLKGVHYGGNGSLYFINQSQSIASFDPDEGWGFLELPASMAPFSQQEDLLVFSDDNIWLATTEDVFHFDGNTWNAYQLGGCSSIINSQEKIYARGGDRIYVIENEV
ncbi:MAG: two-component regulator propeller domain-containing protein, partial [Bacteroidota bacterium]